MHSDCRAPAGRNRALHGEAHGYHNLDLNATFYGHSFNPEVVMAPRRTGVDTYNAELVAKAGQCSIQPRAELTAKGPGYEAYSVRRARTAQPGPCAANSASACWASRPFAAPDPRWPRRRVRRRPAPARSLDDHPLERRVGGRRLELHLPQGLHQQLGNHEVAMLAVGGLQPGRLGGSGAAAPFS